MACSQPGGLPLAAGLATRALELKRPCEEIQRYLQLALPLAAHAQLPKELQPLQQLCMVAWRRLVSLVCLRRWLRKGAGDGAELEMGSGGCIAACRKAFKDRHARFECGHRLLEVLDAAADHVRR